MSSRGSGTRRRRVRRRTSTRLFVGVSIAALVTMAIVGAVYLGGGERARQASFEAGNLYLEAEQYREAIIEYRNALREDPQFAAARLKLAEAFARKGFVAVSMQYRLRPDMGFFPHVDLAELQAANLTPTTIQSLRSSGCAITPTT